MSRRSMHAPGRDPGRPPDPDPRGRPAAPPGTGGCRLLTVGAATADGAAPAFEAILGHLGAARESIDIHMYVWRSDAIGNAVGEALLAAADRGVRVRILKDAGAMLYERVEMNRTPLFGRRTSWRERILIRLGTRLLPDTFVEDAFDHATGDALEAHPNVAVEWVRGTHTKYYLIDRAILLTGSINLEDRHRRYFDYMIEITDPVVIADFLEIRDGSGAVPDRDVAVVANVWREGRRDFRILDRILGLLGGARRRIGVEMAYLGEPTVTRALADAAWRGVEVVVLFSLEANIGNDLNYRTMLRLFRRAPVCVYRTPKMVHSKMLLIDDAMVLTGSANLSVFSMRKAGELDIFIRNRPELVAAFRDEFEARRGVSERVRDARALRAYNPAAAVFQQWSQKLVVG